MTALARRASVVRGATFDEGVTALHVAALGGHTKCCRLLLGAGASLADVDVDGESARDYALRSTAASARDVVALFDGTEAGARERDSLEESTIGVHRAIARPGPRPGSPQRRHGGESSSAAADDPLASLVTEASESSPAVRTRHTDSGGAGNHHATAGRHVVPESGAAAGATPMPQNSSSPPPLPLGGGRGSPPAPLRVHADAEAEADADNGSNGSDASASAPASASAAATPVPGRGTSVRSEPVTPFVGELSWEADEVMRLSGDVARLAAGLRRMEAALLQEQAARRALEARLEAVESRQVAAAGVV